MSTAGTNTNCIEQIDKIYIYLICALHCTLSSPSHQSPTRLYRFEYQLSRKRREIDLFRFAYFKLYVYYIPCLHDVFRRPKSLYVRCWDTVKVFGPQTIYISVWFGLAICILKMLDYISVGSRGHLHIYILYIRFWLWCDIQLWVILFGIIIQFNPDWLLYIL